MNIEKASANPITCGSRDEHENGRACDVKVLGHCSVVSGHGSAVKSIACPEHGCFVRKNAKPCTFELHMRLLKSITTTQDR